MFDLSLANGCIFIKKDASGVLSDAQVALGGKETAFDSEPVAKPEMPALATNLVQYLNGKSLTDIQDEELNKAALKDISVDPKSPEDYSSVRQSTVLYYLKEFFRTMKLQNEPPSQPESRSAVRVYQAVRPDQPDHDAIERPLPNMWATEQACGTATYVDDIPTIRGEFQIVLVQSTMAHAKVTKFDISEAMAAEGVIDIVCAKDLPGKNLWGLFIRDEPIFATERVEYFGQIMAAIVCVSKMLGEKARDLIRIEYEDLGPVLSLQDAQGKGQVIQGIQVLKRNQLGEADTKTKVGNVSGSVTLSGQDHFYMEPHSVLVVPQTEKDELVVYHSTQEPCNVQNQIAHTLGLKRHKIIVKCKRIGGGFGGKERMHNALIAALAARKVRKPVRLIFSRQEDMVVTGHKHETKVDYDVDFDKEGRILRNDFKALVNAGASTDLSVLWTQFFLIRMAGGYTLKNFHGEGSACKTNTPSNTAFRGFGAPEGTIIIENVMEHVAQVLGKDPNAVKELNLAKTGDRSHYGSAVFTECNIQACWDECKRRSRYDQVRADIEQFNRDSSVIKRGVSMTPMKYPVTLGAKMLNQGAALVNIYADGSVYVSHGGVEMGQGLNTKMIQVTSRALGIPTELIHIVETSSEIVPNATPTGGSVSSDFNGAAIIDACSKLNRRLEPYKDQSSWEEVVMAAYLARVNLSATGISKVFEILQSKYFPFFLFPGILHMFNTKKNTIS